MTVPTPRRVGSRPSAWAHRPWGAFRCESGAGFASKEKALGCIKQEIHPPNPPKYPECSTGPKLRAQKSAHPKKFNEKATL